VLSNHILVVRVSVKSGVDCSRVAGVCVPKIFTCGAGAHKVRGGATGTLPSRVSRASLQGQPSLLWDVMRIPSSASAHVFDEEEE
jgi:hypothetical protein